MQGFGGGFDLEESVAARVRVVEGRRMRWRNGRRAVVRSIVGEPGRSGS